MIKQIDPAFVNLAIGLMILVVSNIILGSLNAIFEKEFDLRFFLKGLEKGLLVSAVMFGIYVAGALNPNVIAIDLGGQSLTLISAINALVLAAWLFYGRQVFEKLGKILNVKEIEGNTLEGDAEYHGKDLSER